VTVGSVLSALPDQHRSGPARLRDLIAHRYFSLEPSIIWDVLKQHVPALLTAALDIRRTSPP
jgi:uncharacterized protein with HEPN domain